MTEEFLGYGFNQNYGIWQNRWSSSRNPTYERSYSYGGNGHQEDDILGGIYSPYKLMNNEEFVPAVVKNDFEYFKQVN